MRIVLSLFLLSPATEWTYEPYMILNPLCMESLNPGDTEVTFEGGDPLRPVECSAAHETMHRSSDRASLTIDKVYSGRKTLVSPGVNC